MHLPVKCDVWLNNVQTSQQYNYPEIYYRKFDVIMKRRFWLADVRFYIAGGTCGRCEVVHF